MIRRQLGRHSSAPYEIERRRGRKGREQAEVTQGPSYIRGEGNKEKERGELPSGSSRNKKKNSARRIQGKNQRNRETGDNKEGQERENEKKEEQRERKKKKEEAPKKVSPGEEKRPLPATQKNMERGKLMALPIMKQEEF